MSSATHYDEAYFAWQQAQGMFGATVDVPKFCAYVHAQQVVLDFGCGGGYLLSALDCRTRYGVEINPAAAAEARKRLNGVFPSVGAIPDGLRFDLVISNHALEHVENPIETLRELRARIAPAGKVVCVVPAESWYQHRRYDPEDINHHLYTWTPLLLGNLFTHAGYTVERVDTLCNRWPPKTALLHRVLPSRLFRYGCRLWAFVTGYRELRIVAGA